MKNPSWNEVLYCHKCGNIDVQVMAWVNANTDEYVCEAGDDAWCDYCEDHTPLTTLPELWSDFHDYVLPHSAGDTIGMNFLSFPAGTPQSTVLQWFKERMPAEEFDKRINH